MRQVPFSVYTAGSWDAVIQACEYDEGYGPEMDQVTHLDGAGRRFKETAKPVPGDLIVIVSDMDEQFILWLDYSSELVQLVE
jgi:hypothetical protein